MAYFGPTKKIEPFWHMQDNSSVVVCMPLQECISLESYVRLSQGSETLGIGSTGHVVGLAEMHIRGVMCLTPPAAYIPMVVCMS